MAYEYQSFATLGVNLNRQNYGALDISQVFTSQADLDYYLSKGTKTTGVSEYWYKDADNKIVPYPYEGQVLATVFNGVVKVYVLALNEKGEFVTQNVGDTSTVEASIKALEDLVGELPKTTDAKTIVEYVNKKTEGIATSDSLSQLQRDVDAVEALVGVPAKKATDDTEAVVASGLHRALDDEIARAKAAEESLDSRLDTLEAKEDKDTTYSVASGEKILKLTGTEFSTVASLKYVAATETTNAKIQLLGIDSAVVSEIDASEFVKDGFLKNVELKESDANHSAENGPYLVFTWNIDNAIGEDEDITEDVLWVPVKGLIDVYEAGDGISIEGKTISHADTSSVDNITKIDRTYVAGITFDDFGHVTAIETATETDPDYTNEFNAKADKVVGATEGNFAGLDKDGNLTDSGKKATDFAEASHNHDGVYAPIDHKHDDDYAAKGHKHTVSEIEDYATDVAGKIDAKISTHSTSTPHLTTEDVNGQIDTKLNAYDTSSIADGKYVAKETYNTFTGQYADDKQGIEKSIADEADARADADTQLQAAIDGKLGEITTTTNGGLKVTHKNQIDIDDSIVFILDGGTAADLIVE